MAVLSAKFSPGLLVLAGWLGLCGTTPAAAAPSSGVVAQQSVYAAFVVNITRFVLWPETAFRSVDEPIVIGTFERAAINDELDRAVQGERVGARPLKTLRIHSLDDLARCQAVYLEGADPQQNAVLSRIAGRPVLAIGDGDGFLELGGHIRFVPKPPRTQLRIRLANLRSSGLQVRSQLLRLAQVEGP